MHSLHDAGPYADPPRPFNLAEHVLCAGAAAPDKIALQILRPAGAERWSYGRLTAAVRGVARGLHGMGLPPGARVLLRLGNTVDFPLAFLGAVAAGLVPVPTPAGLTVPEATRIARALAPALVVAGAGLALPDPAELPGSALLPAAALRRFEALAPLDWQRGDPDRPGYIVFTSGSSGQPRGVVHAHRAILGRGMMTQGWYGLGPGDRLLHAGAFNWTFTLGTGLLDPWTAGATALIPAEGVAPAQLPLLLRRFDATLFAAAPGVYRRMLRGAGPLALPRLRHGLSAGEKMAEATRAAWEAATGTPVFEALGMSEVSTFVSAAPGRPAPPGAIGWPQPGRRVAVLDGGGRPVPRGTPGVLAVHRSDPGLFLGYLDAAEATAARFAADWFLTGDTVVMDAAGAVTYLGRDDDMMNAGGFRVSPLEVEAALEAHPQVAESAAVELPVAGGASVIAAFYVPRPAAAPAAAAAGEETTATPEPEAATALQEALAAHLAGRLARYKQPRLLIAVPALPRSANGKINRRALRQQGETGA